MRKLITLATLITLMISKDCISQSYEIPNLRAIINAINKVKNASYKSTNYFCYSGDTIPSGEKHYEFFKEYSMPIDTSVGAAFVTFNMEDTTKMILAYDSKIRARIDWEKYEYEKDDFSKNPWPYRTVLAPFFAKSKALIEYILNTNDSIQIDSIFNDNYISYKFSIINERVELVGRLPIHINEIGSNDGVISEYVLWVDKKTLLPYKFQRTLPSNTMIDKIYDLHINNLNQNEFSIANYIPEDMPERKDEKTKSTDAILNTVVNNWYLSDLNNEFHNLKDESSKVYMIDCTSVHCGPCLLSTPYLKELYQKYSKKGFSFVSLYNENEKNYLIKYTKDKEINYDILLAHKNTFDSLQIKLTPTFIFLDKDKVVKKIIYGFENGKTENEIEETIKGLL